MYWVGFNLFFVSDSEASVFWNLLPCSLLSGWPWQCIQCVPARAAFQWAVSRGNLAGNAAEIWTFFFFNCIISIVSLHLPKITALALKTPRGSEGFCFPGLCGVSRACLGMSDSSLFSRRQARAGGSWPSLSSSLNSHAVNIAVGPCAECRDAEMVAKLSPAMDWM